MDGLKEGDVVRWIRCATIQGTIKKLMDKENALIVYGKDGKAVAPLRELVLMWRQPDDN